MRWPRRIITGLIAVAALTSGAVALGVAPASAGACYYKTYVKQEDQGTFVTGATHIEHAKWHTGGSVDGCIGSYVYVDSASHYCSWYSAGGYGGSCTSWYSTAGHAQVDAQDYEVFGTGMVWWNPHASQDVTKYAGLAFRCWLSAGHVPDTAVCRGGFE